MMDKALKNEKLALWLTPISLIVLGQALITLAHFIPPPSPLLGADEIVARFRENSMGIRLGMMLFMFCGTMLAPITAIYCVLIQRIEGHAGVLTYTQMVTGTIALMLFIPPTVIWSVAAYRPDRSPEMILMLNDMGWLFFIMTVAPGVLQVIVLGIAILQDKRAVPLFPRWVGYLNLWAALVLAPGGLAALFKSGPFAWNGLITFWIALPVFGCWFFLMFFTCWRAVKIFHREDAAASAGV
jgi:hypothetical protein